MPKAKVNYEIIIWIGASNSSRDIGYFDISNAKPHAEALEYFQDSYRQAIEDGDDGYPYISIKKWINDGDDVVEYGNGGVSVGWDYDFDDLPKFVKTSIAKLVEFQKTIEYSEY